MIEGVHRGSPSAHVDDLRQSQAPDPRQRNTSDWERRGCEDCSGWRQCFTETRVRCTRDQLLVLRCTRARVDTPRCLCRFVCRRPSGGGTRFDIEQLKSMHSEDGWRIKMLATDSIIR